VRGPECWWRALIERSWSRRSCTNGPGVARGRGQALGLAPSRQPRRLVPQMMCIEVLPWAIGDAADLLHRRG
jgi:hypothetical protein